MRKLGGIHALESVPEGAKELLEEVHDQIISKISEKSPTNRRFYSNWEIVSYGRQVVAGVNHFFKIAVGENTFFHVVVYQNLRGQNVVTRVELNKTAEDRF